LCNSELPGTPWTAYRVFFSPKPIETKAAAAGGQFDPCFLDGPIETGQGSFRSMSTVDLFPQDQSTAFASRSEVDRYFDLDGDMSKVERSFLADLLTEVSDHDCRCDYKKQDRQRAKHDRFRRCGEQGSRLSCPECAISFYTRFFCKHKLCDRCARIYGGEIRRRIKGLVTPIFAEKKKGWTVALLTLSESSAVYRGRYPNAEEYQAFNRHVSEFCRLFYGKYRGTWTRKGKVREDRKRYQGAGWFAVNEFGQDNTNLHAHVLLYGPWIPHKKLLAAWIKITGGHRGCHIEPIRNPKVAASYVSKYLTKPPRFLDPNTAVKFVLATHRQRRIRTGGIFYNCLARKQEKRPVDLCPFCVQGLRHDGVCDLTESAQGLNLKYVRDNRELFATEELKNLVRFLPGGVMPVGLPECPSLLPN